MKPCFRLIQSFSNLLTKIPTLVLTFSTMSPSPRQSTNTWSVHSTPPKLQYLSDDSRGYLSLVVTTPIDTWSLILHLTYSLTITSTNQNENIVCYPDSRSPVCI
jgi:hypothetical protein